MSRLAQAHLFSAVACAAALSCSAPVTPDTSSPEAVQPARIVTTERGPRGGRLVAVDESGVRVRDLTPIEAGRVIDSDPSYSPDGRWVVFTSNRGNDALELTSLWLVPSTGGELIRLTDGSRADRNPRFMSDGRSIVFAATEGGGTFDLWRLPFDGQTGGPAGPPVRLTDSADIDELSPSPFPDGKRLAYMAVDRSQQKSSIWILDMESEQRKRLTEGPFDATPSVSPDGQTVVFAAPVVGRDDMELHAIDADGSNRRVVVEDAIGDETGPVWTSDGRWLFATSVVRSAAGEPILGCLVMVDMREQGPALRVLHDPNVLVSRLGVALAPGFLDASVLHKQRAHTDETLFRLKQQARNNQSGQASPNNRGQPGTRTRP